jgi:hypothetical protein
MQRRNRTYRQRSPPITAANRARLARGGAGDLGRWACGVAVAFAAPPVVDTLLVTPSRGEEEGERP